MRIISLIIILITLCIFCNHAYAVSNNQNANSKDFQINGVGASFPYPLIDLWRIEYEKINNNVHLNYQSIGSGGGIKQHIEKTVDFAATDIPLKNHEKEIAIDTLHIPETLGGVVIIYNIPEFSNKGLKLTAKNIADIYLSKITRWNDKFIVSNNQEIKTLDKHIIPVRRSDSSGTTHILTNYLSLASTEFEKNIGNGKSVPWSAGVAAIGNEGVATIVRSTPYTIGYVELAYVFQTGMSFAYIQNADKTNFVEPTLESIAYAAKEMIDELPESDEDWSKVKIINAPGIMSYPLSSFTYLLIHNELSDVVKSLEHAKTLVQLIDWMITEGQSYSESLFYVKLPEKVSMIGKKGLSKIKYNNEFVFKHNSNNVKNDNIPEWIKNNAKWWSEGLISDKDYFNGLNYLISKNIIKM